MRQAICLAISMRSERDDTSALASSLKRGEKSAHFWWRNDICPFRIKDFWVSSDLTVENCNILHDGVDAYSAVVSAIVSVRTILFLWVQVPLMAPKMLLFCLTSGGGTHGDVFFFFGISFLICSLFETGLFLAYWSIYIAHGEMQIGHSVIMAFGTKSHRPFITFVLVLLRCGGRGCNIYEYPRK